MTKRSHQIAGWVVILLSLGMLIGALFILRAGIGAQGEAADWQTGAPALLGSASLGMLLMVLGMFGFLVGWTLQKSLAAEEEERQETMEDRVQEGIAQYDAGDGSLIGDAARTVRRFIDWLGEQLGDVEFDD